MGFLVGFDSFVGFVGFVSFCGVDFFFLRSSSIISAFFMLDLSLMLRAAAFSLSSLTVSFSRPRGLFIH